MKADVIMSHFARSDLTVRALNDIGSRRTIHLVDNAFLPELKDYALVNPHVHYLRSPELHPGPLDGKWDGTGMKWSPLSLAESWNWCLLEAKTDWVIDVNPDIVQWPHAIQMIEQLLIEKRQKDVVLVRTQVNFNVWAGDRKALLDLGGFDERFVPCGAEDEDLLVRISQAGLKWTQATVPVMHVGGGHKSRADNLGGFGPYCNTRVFVEKWGWKPHSPEYNALVSRGRA